MSQKFLMEVRPTVQIDPSRLERFCHRWQIQTLDLFGSILREDFSQHSDVDLLVTFAPDTRWTLLDWVDMEDELAGIFGRSVDLVSRQAIEQSHNINRRKRILESAQSFISQPGGTNYAVA